MSAAQQRQPGEISAHGLCYVMLPRTVRQRGQAKYIGLSVAKRLPRVQGSKEAVEIKTKRGVGGWRQGHFKTPRTHTHKNMALLPKQQSGRVMAKSRCLRGPSQ